MAIILPLYGKIIQLAEGVKVFLGGPSPTDLRPINDPLFSYKKFKILN